MNDKSTEQNKTGPIWVNKKQCKSCGECVWVCPTKVLSMQENEKSLHGESVSVDYPDLCIGCYLCVNVCPELFCIFVKDKKEFKYPKKPKDISSETSKNEGSD